MAVIRELFQVPANRQIALVRYDRSGQGNLASPRQEKTHTLATNQSPLVKRIRQ
jgi:hypothetical protein